MPFPPLDCEPRFGHSAEVIVRYEADLRTLIGTSRDRALEVRRLRVDDDGTWRYVGAECQQRWNTEVGRGDTQSFCATLCHVAAEVLGEDPDAEPWY